MILVDIKYTPMRFFITLTVLVFCCVLHCSAQRNVKDSLQYYNQQLSRLYRRVWDSLDQNDSARYYRRQIRSARARARDYVAFTFFGGVEHANYNTFNAAIAKDGFVPIRGQLIQFGGGASFRGYSGIIIDLNYVVAGLGSSTYNGAASIRTSSIETLNLQIGYAVINTGRFSFYPYVGIANRFSTLDYSTPDTANPNYTSIASLVQGGKSVSTTSDVFCYQAGVGVDWIIHQVNNYRSGTILFAKFGTDGVFGNETYPIANVTYDPGIRYGAWVAQLGFKFFIRS
jgi:hypothetical protein